MPPVIKLIWFLFFTVVMGDGSFTLAIPPPEQETGGQERIRQMQETEGRLWRPTRFFCRHILTTPIDFELKVMQ